MGTAEIESALVSDSKIAEVMVVGYAHDIKGQGIYCYVTPMTGVQADMMILKMSLSSCALKRLDLSPSQMLFSGR